MIELLTVGGVVALFVFLLYLRLFRPWLFVDGRAFNVLKQNESKQSLEYVWHPVLCVESSELALKAVNDPDFKVTKGFVYHIRKSEYPDMELVEVMLGGYAVLFPAKCFVNKGCIE